MKPNIWREIYEKRGKRDQAIQYYMMSLVAEDASPVARAKLTALGVKDIDRRMPDARTELSAARHRGAQQIRQRHGGILPAGLARQGRAGEVHQGR